MVQQPASGPVVVGADLRGAHGTIFGPCVSGEGFSETEFIKRIVAILPKR